MGIQKRDFCSESGPVCNPKSLHEYIPDLPQNTATVLEKKKSVLAIIIKQSLELLEEIHQLDVKHKAHLDLVDAQKLETLRNDLSQCLYRKVRNKHRYFANLFNEQGNKGVG